MKGNLVEVSKIIKGIDDLPLDYLFQVRSEDNKRLSGHLHMVTNPRARLAPQAFTLVSI